MGKIIRLTNEQEEALCLIDTDLKSALNKLLEKQGIFDFLSTVRNRLKSIEARLFKLEKELNW